MIQLLLHVLDSAPEDFFDTLVFKETPADDILGPRDVMAMKRGEVMRLVAGYLPTSVVAYLDEFFKSSPTLANAILDIMAQRKLKVGRTIIDCSQQLCIYASSNELPDREDMQPVRDRFGLTKFVQPVRSPEGRKAVMRIQDEYQASARNVDLSDAPRISLDDVRQIRTEVQRIILPDAVIESMATAQERWAQKGFDPSQRRVGQMLMAIKARAWTRGDGHATTDDMIVTQHMAWNHPDHAEPAREVVLEFANVFARKAARMKEALEPILTELDAVRKSINEAGGEPGDEHMEAAFKVMRQLRSLRREAREQIDAGTQQGQDVRDLEAVQQSIADAHNWVERTMTEEET
jgi:MoxR-like ATPase